MRILKNINEYSSLKERKSVIAIGNFDGVHLGHKAVINELRKISNNENLTSCVLTFEPHPKKVLFDKEFRILQDTNEKSLILTKFNIDTLIIHPFTKNFSEYSPEKFVSEIVKNQFHAAFVVVGNDFSFGANHKGNIQALTEILREHDIKTVIVQPVIIDGMEIHSTVIREFISKGQIKEANKYLAEPYSLYCEVVRGEGRGSQIGFPTLNMFEHSKVIPAKGAYVSKTILSGKMYDSVTNIGVNPTFEGKELKIETHILDFNADVYGQYAKIIFIDKLRDEKRFKSIEELVVQIKQDVAARKKYG